MHVVAFLGNLLHVEKRICLYAFTEVDSCLLALAAPQDIDYILILIVHHMSVALHHCCQENEPTPVLLTKFCSSTGHGSMHAVDTGTGKPGLCQWVLSRRASLLRRSTG